MGQLYERHESHSRRSWHELSIVRSPSTDQRDRDRRSTRPGRWRRSGWTCPGASSVTCSTRWPRHSGWGLDLKASGDTHIDLHHTVEDTGIVLGDAILEALGERRGIVRFASAYAPLDEALARAVIDISGRGFFSFSAPAEIERSWVTSDFPFTLVGDFFQALADRGRFTLHLHILEARNPHHAAEAAFKAAAVALRQAIAVRPEDAEVPSTKGTLNE